MLINDLPSVVEFCKFHLYADDFVIYLSGPFKDAQTIISKVNCDLDNISRWAADNGLSINTQKTQAMWVGSRGYINKMDSLNLLSVLLNGTTVAFNKSLKVLGVVLDSKITWREQSNATVKKSFAALARLRKHNGFLPDATKMLPVKALIFPYFDYAAGIFLDLSNELALKLSRCKNTALRFVTGTKIFEHITPVYREHEILSFTARRDYLAISIMASIFRNGEPHLLEDFQFRKEHREGSKRRSLLNLEVTQFKTESLRFSFKIRAAYLWNELPCNLRSLFTRPCFKQLLYDFYCDKI